MRINKALFTYSSLHNDIYLRDDNPNMRLQCDVGPVEPPTLTQLVVNTLGEYVDSSVDVGPNPDGSKKPYKPTAVYNSSQLQRYSTGAGSAVQFSQDDTTGPGSLVMRMYVHSVSMLPLTTAMCFRRLIDPGNF